MEHDRSRPGVPARHMDDRSPSRRSRASVITPQRSARGTVAARTPWPASHSGLRLFGNIRASASAGRAGARSGSRSRFRALARRRLDGPAQKTSTAPQVRPLGRFQTAEVAQVPSARPAGSWKPQRARYVLVCFRLAPPFARRCRFALLRASASRFWPFRCWIAVLPVRRSPAARGAAGRAANAYRECSS